MTFARGGEKDGAFSKQSPKWRATCTNKLRGKCAELYLSLCTLRSIVFEVSRSLRNQRFRCCDLPKKSPHSLQAI